MKKIRGLFVFCCACIIVYLAFLVVQVIGLSDVPKMTPERAQKLFESAGSINKINSEARWLIDHADPDRIFLFPNDLTNSPAILSLYSTCETYSGRDYSGTSVAIFPENGRHLEIKFGNHWSLKHIYIFDSNTMAVSNLPSERFQVSTNIFVTR